MNNEKDTQLDAALELLLEGASLPSLMEKYPEIADELSGYEKIVRVASVLRTEVPSEHGLHIALDAAAPVHIAKKAQPSAYYTFFSVYRGALVLPVLFIVLLGAGVWNAYPTKPRVENESVPQAFETSVQTANQATESTSGEDSAPQVPASFKAGPEARMMLMSVPAEDSSTSTATSTASTSDSINP